jgi:hypothetical protein
MIRKKLDIITEEMPFDPKGSRQFFLDFIGEACKVLTEDQVKKISQKAKEWGNKR